MAEAATLGLALRLPLPRLLEAAAEAATEAATVTATKAAAVTSATPDAAAVGPFAFGSGVARSQGGTVPPQ